MTYFTQQPEGMGIGPLSKSSFLQDAFVFVASHLLDKYVWRKSYTLFSELRNFLGSLHIQLAIDRLFVNYGPKLESDPQVSERNRRTLARMKGIRNLLAIYPYVTHQNVEIYLMGFDAGEQWALDNQGSIPHPVQCEPKSTSEFLSLAFSQLIPIFQAIDAQPFQDRSEELVATFRLEMQKRGLPLPECLEPVKQSPPIALPLEEPSASPLQLRSDMQESDDDISSSPAPERKPKL
jgi:hypothetical protein